MEGSPGAQPDLRSAVDALWRRRRLFLGIVISIPILVFLISTQLPKTYEAFTLIRTQTTAIEVPGVATSSVSAIGSEALLIDTPQVTEAAAEELGMPASEAGSLVGSVRADVVTTSSGADTDLLQLTAQADSGQRAADVANAFATAIDRVRTDEKLEAIDTATEKLQRQSADADQATRLELASQLQQLRAARAAEADSTETVQPAATPLDPISPNPERNTALAAVVALLLGLAAVVVRERLDRRLRDENELERLLETPLLSTIPQAAFPGARPAPVPVRESFRTLAASLVYFNVDHPVSTVMITSPTKGDGKTTVAVHLAIALAQDGQDVVLVDADLRHPQVALRLGVEPSIGLTEVVTGQGEVADALVQVDVGDGDFRVLAAGGQPPNPARLLSSQRMRTLLAELSETADIVIVDTPPLLTVSDGVPLLESVSGTVLVAKVGATTSDALLRVRQVIDTARGTLLGVVATGSGGAGLYGYGGEYYGEGVPERQESPPPGSEGVVRGSDAPAAGDGSAPEPARQADPNA